VVLIIIVAVVALFAIIAVASAVQAKRQRAALQGWAATRGWTYAPGGGGPWLQYLPRGDARRGVGAARIVVSCCERIPRRYLVGYGSGMVGEHVF
jgi:hypothetical protein